MQGTRVIRERCGKAAGWRFAIRSAVVCTLAILPAGCRSRLFQKDVDVCSAPAVPEPVPAQQPSAVSGTEAECRRLQEENAALRTELEVQRRNNQQQAARAAKATDVREEKLREDGGRRELDELLSIQ